MATDLERLVVQLSADVKGYEREMRRAQGITNREATKIERRFQRINRSFDGLGAGLGRSLIAPLSGIAAALSVREVIQYADAWKRAQNSLRVAGVPAAELAGTLERLFDISQGAGADISSTVTLFSRLSQSAKELGASQEDLFRFTQGVGDALKVAGTDAQSASGALLQLSQALGGAVVRAEEFNSIQDGARPILQAVADGLEEAGGSVSKLGNLVRDGQVTSRAFFEAFLKGSQGLAQQAAQASTTFGQAFTKIENAFTRYIGQTDESLGASQRLIQGLEALADNFDETADIALQFAGILASGILGRALFGLAGQAVIASTALVTLINNLRKARSLAQVSVALSGVGAAAAPLGLLFGVAAGAAVLYATSGDEAAQSSEELRAELVRLGLAGDGAVDGIENAADALDRLTQGDRARLIRDIRRELERLQTGENSLAGFLGFGETDSLDDIIRQTVELQRGLSGIFGVSQQDKAVANEIARLAAELQDIDPAAEGAAEQVQAIRQRLEELKQVEVSGEVDNISVAFEGVIDRIIEAINAQRELNAEVAEGASEVSKVAEAYRQYADSRRAGEIIPNEVAQQRLDEASRTDVQRRLDERTEALIKAVEDAGGSITEASARIKAAAEIAAEDLAKAAQGSVDASANLIKRFEGFRSTPYFDVNAFRAGFGSDTVTLSDGSVRKVTEGITVSVTDANRDLVRRIGEFQDTIRGQIGSSTFDQFSEEQQAALTSIAYNYGSLPDRIVEAILTGSQETIFNAIRNLGGDNGGINRRRRESEADVFLGGAPELLREDIELRREQSDVIRQTIESLRLSAEANTLEAETLGLSTFERERARAALELEQALKSQGIVITEELAAAIQNEATAYAQSVAGIEAKTQANEQLRASEERLVQQQQQVEDAFSGAFRGFVSDILNGKSAVDALADAVGRLGQQLIDLALQGIFQQLFGAAFGGFNFGSLFGFAQGGYTGPGGKYQPAGIVHKGEYVIPKEAVDRIGVRNLDRIAALRGYAQGGLVVPSVNTGAQRIADMLTMQRQAPQVDVPIRIINAFDSAAVLAEALGTAAGERAILNFFRARPGAFRSVMNGR